MGKKPEISTSNFKSDLFDNFTDIILFIDLKGRVLYANKAVNKYGFKESDLIGESTYKLVVKKHVLQLTKEMLDLAKGKPTHGSVEIIAPKGNFFMEYKSRPIKKNGKVIALQTILRDITEQKNAEKLLKQKLLFENILNELSMSFIDYDKELVDDVINKALETIGNYFHADRSYIFSVSGKFMSNTHEWCRKGVKPEINNLKNINLKKELPWFNKQILKLKPFVVESVAKLPSEAKLEKKHFQLQKIKSLITIPLTENNELKGFIGLDIVESETKIDKKVKDEISTISGLFNNFLRKNRIGKKLIESEEKLRTTVESISDAFFTLNQDLRFTYFNKKSEELLNKKSKDILGKQIFNEVFKEAKGSIFEEKYTYALKNNKLVTFEIFFGKKPYINWYDVRVYPSKEGISVYFTITTERKKAEEDLRESEEKLKDIFESAPVLMTISKVDGTIINVNNSCKSMLGYTKKEFLDLGWTKLSHPDDLKRIAVELKEKQLKGDSIINFVNRYKHKNGSYRTLEWQTTHAGKYIYAAAVDITEKKLSEEALKESESKLLKSQEIGLIGTWKLDIVNDILEWTEQNYKIFGVKQGASLNLSSFLATIHPDDKEYVAKKWTEGLKSGVYNLEHRIIVKGKVKWVKEKAKILFDKKGKAINAIGITQDITEKKLFETKLIESENKFRTVYQKIPVPYQSLDSNGDLLDVNPAWLNILGYKKQDVIGKNFSEFVSSDKLNDFKSNFSNFKKTGTACDILFSMKQKNGEHILVEYNGTAEYDENGVFQRTHCIFQDITSRELSKKKLKESEEKFKTLVNKVSDIIYSYDINGNIIFVSDNIGKYGYRVKEVLGKPLSNFVHPDDLKSVMKDFEMLWKTGKVTTTEFRLKLKNGKYIFAEESGQLIYENNKPVKVVGVIRDITERKQAEEELIVSEEQLMEAQEVASIGSWSFDVKTAQPIWSEQLFKIFGIDPKKGELNYKEHKKYIHPKDWNLFNDSVANTTKTGVGYNIEIRLVQPSGNIVWVNARCKTKKEKGVVVKLIGTTQDITDKKLAEEKLKESEEQFRNMIDTVPGVVYKCDMNWTFSFASFAFKEVTGFPVSDVINNKVRSYVSLMFEDDVTRITPVLNKALKKKDKYFFSEYKLKTKTGDIKWVRDSVRIVYNKNGVAKGYEGVLSDITNIKTAEGELRKEKEFSENILKALPEGMDIVDENLNILYMNEFFLNIFGKKAIGKKCYNLYKDNKKQCGDCPLKKPIKLGERRSIITTGVAGNRTYEINHVGMNLKGKKVIMEIFRDITDQKEAENLLEASEKKYKTIIEHSDDMFYIHDTNHKLSYVNPLSKRVFGYTPEEMMVKWTTLTTKNPINDEGLKLTVKALKTGVIQKPYILEFKKKNGEIFWAEIDEAPIKNSSGKIIGIAGALRDVTHRKKSDEALKRRTEELEKFHTYAINRELQMIKLKEEIKRLKKKQ